MKQFTLNGKDYTYQPEDLLQLSIGEARELKANTGLTIMDWHQGLLNFYRGDPDVLAGIVWVALRRAGEPISWADIDAISTVDLLASVSEVDEPVEAPVDEPVEAPAEAPADPPEPVKNGRTSSKRKTAATAS